MPDEQSNLNLPPSARRPNIRRRGRRGGRGRGRGPRPAEEAAQSQTPGDVDPNAEPLPEGSLPEAREPGDSQPAVAASVDAAPEIAPAAPAAEQPAPAPRPQPMPPRQEHRPEQRQERRPDNSPQKPWVKPADFRPADTSAIHQAVVHATEIAEGLRELVDRIDEILELVEVAERQKLADERELDNLRRALRRIQPPRQSHGHEPNRGHSRPDTRPRPDFVPPRQDSGPAREPASEAHGDAPEATEATGPDRGFREPHPESHAEDHGDLHAAQHGESHEDGPSDAHPGEIRPES